MKKKLLVLCLIGVALLSMLFLTSCEQLTDLLNGNYGKKKDGEPPSIVGLETIKASKDYLKSEEYLYNSQGTNPMALTFSEDYYLVIHYSNESKYTVSSVMVTWRDSTKAQPASQKFERETFAEGSNETVTYIPFSVGDETQTRPGSIVYTVTTILYVSGANTDKMGWGEDVDHSITVNVRPSFKLTLNYMNEDLRKGVESERQTEEKSNVFYQTQMNTYIVSPDYKGTKVVPTKGGGWVFAGWYTEPFGQGRFIGEDDFYYFWSDTTLYAHYERMFDVELEEMSYEIEHEYRKSGKDMTITFTTGAVLKNAGKNNQESVRSNYLLDIPDTIVVEKHTVIKGNRASDNMPTYDAKITGTEYPVIRIDNNAFDQFNTIKQATMGKYVQEIGYRAFCECTDMETLSFSSGSTLKYIGDFAFQKTTVLGHSSPFTLPSTVEYLGMCAFRYSGWGITRNNGTSTAGESVLYIPATWKYIGYKCFFQTCFKTVVFRAGCHFDSQITDEEGDNNETARGSRTIRYGQNRIGAQLFACCYPLQRVFFECDAGEENGLNIIPDMCFSAKTWYNKVDQDRDGAFQCIDYISFAEGLTYIGKDAFTYQVKIPELCLPKTLEEVDNRAFYHCISVTNLNFEHVDQETINKEGVKKALTNKSRLRVLKSNAFGNLYNIDVVYITSEYFALYGNGVFQGCQRLKCIIFNNIRSADSIPTGFKSSNAKFGYSAANGDVINDDEVMTGHEMSDFLFGTAESGEKETGEDEFSITYSNPVRVFCATEYVNDLKKDMLIGKRLTAGNTSSGTKSYNSQVFVHSLDNLYEYKYTLSNGDEAVVSVAVQQIYKASGGKPTTTVLGYSLVYWSARSDEIRLPTHTDLNLTQGKIIELAAYALPTSVVRLYIPDTYERLEHDALNGCTALTEVVYEDINTLKYVGQYAFEGTGITSFVGGSALKVIGPYAFHRCASLIWVDLKESILLVNAYNGRETNGLSQYKYEYELDDYDYDLANCLGNSAFQECTALQWIWLPTNIQQIRSSTFWNCKSLKTIVIPTEHPSANKNANDDDCFYEYGQPNTVFKPEYLHQISFYVHSAATDIHQSILSPAAIAGGRYNLIDAAPAHP